MSAQQIVGVPDEFYDQVKKKYAGRTAAFVAVPLGKAFRVGIVQPDLKDIDLAPPPFGEFNTATEAWKRADRLNLYTFGLNTRKASRIIAPMMGKQPDLFGFRIAPQA
jgi:hypothetical protein